MVDGILYPKTPLLTLSQASGVQQKGTQVLQSLGVAPHSGTGGAGTAPAPLGLGFCSLNKSNAAFEDFFKYLRD